MEEEDLSNIEITVTPNPPPEGETNNTNPEGSSELDLGRAVEQARNPTESMKEDDAFWLKALKDVGKGITEAPQSAARGGYKFVNSASQLVLGNIPTVTLEDSEGQVLDPLSRSSYADNDYRWTLRTRSREENMLQTPEALMPEEPESVTGSLIEGAAQFAAGYALTGPALKMAGISVQPLGQAGSVGQTLGRSALAEQIAFDPHDERFSNWIQETPLANPFNEWMAADGDEEELEARFKMGAEGLLVGGVMESIIPIGRLMRSRKALREAEAQGKEQEAQQHAESIMEQVEELERVSEERGSIDEVAPSGWGEPEQMDLPLEGGQSSRDDMSQAVDAETPSGSQASRRPTRGRGEDVVDQPVKRVVDVGDEELADIVSFSIREDGFGQGRNLTGLNLDLIENSDDIRSMMNSLSSLYRDKWDQAYGPMGDVRSWEVVEQNRQQLGEILGQDPKLIMQSMQRHGVEMRHADAQMKLYMDMLTTVGNKTYELAKLVDDPLGGTGPYSNRQELEVEFAKHLELLGHLQENMRGIKTSYGRAFNAFKMGGEDSLDLQGMDIKKVWSEDSGNIRRLARRVALTEGGTKEITKAARGGFFAKAQDAINEYWINSILSGLTTHQVNMWSSIAATAFHPLEKSLAGALRGDRQKMAEGAWQYAFMATEFTDALKLSGKALRHGKNMADPVNEKYELRNAITSKNYGVTNPMAATVIDGIGNTIRLPSRLLMTEDEFIKQWTARSAVKARAFTQARERGLSGDEASAFIAQSMDEAFDPKTGRLIDESVLEESRANTFTSDTHLNPEDTWRGTQAISTTVQQALEHHPSGRLVIPFVRTPTNLTRFVLDRTPVIGLARKQNLNRMRGKHGPEEQAMFFARQATGAAMWGTAMYLAGEGVITGSGPTDWQTRQQMELGGWKPFSLRVFDDNGNPEYIPISRLGPFADFFTLAAGFSEVAGQVGEREYDEAATAMSVATIELLKDKTFLEGLSNLLGAMNDPERFKSSFVGSIAGGFVPNILNQNVKNDELLREAYSVVDNLKRRAPGFSETLDPRRTVLGEAQVVPPSYGSDWVSPFISYTAENARGIPRSEEFMNQIQTDPRHELARLAEITGRVIGDVQTSFGEIDWREHKSSVSGYTFYDRIRELSGTMKINGKTLIEALEESIQSSSYVRTATDGDETGHSSRMNILSKIISDYRKAALQEALKEEPDLQELYREELKRQGKLQSQRHGGPAAPMNRGQNTLELPQQ